MAAVATRVDLGALTCTIKNEAMQRVAELFAGTLATLEGSGSPLSERQVAEFVEAIAFYMDGFERAVATPLVEAFNQAGVPIWGLPNSLRDLAPDSDE